MAAERRPGYDSTGSCGFDKPFVDPGAWPAEVWCLFDVIVPLDL